MGAKRKPIYGVGINDADYNVYSIVDGNQVQCVFYQRWASMITRCYSSVYHDKFPTYKDCYVCDEWKYFSNFKKWMEHQQWEGMELDKDILNFGNKEYSPEKCVFVNNVVNSFVTEKTKSSWCPIGVSYHKASEKLQAQCRNPFTKKYEYLGLYDDATEAHLAWVNRKLELAEKLVKSKYVTDKRIANAIINKYKKMKLMAMTN